MDASLKHVLDIPQTELSIANRCKLCFAAQVGRQTVHQVGRQIDARRPVGCDPPLVQVQLHFQLNLRAVQRRHVGHITRGILQ